jgi:quercetin dioxygenase-like cupin family protein
MAAQPSTSLAGVAFVIMVQGLEGEGEALQTSTGGALLPPAPEGRALWFLGGLAVIHASFEETAGNLTFLEGVDPPDSMPPLHVHPDQDEGVYVLEGGVRLFVGRTVIDLEPGSYGMMPRGIPHTFRTSPTGNTRTLSFTTGPFDEFMRELGVPAKEMRLPSEAETAWPEPAEIDRLAELRGIKILGPPGMLPTELPEYGDSSS